MNIYINICVSTQQYYFISILKKVYSENNRWLEQTPQGRGQAPVSDGGSQNATGQDAR